LHKLAHGGNYLAVRILHTVYANPSENYQVSFNLLTQAGSFLSVSGFFLPILIHFSIWNRYYFLRRILKHMNWGLFELKLGIFYFALILKLIVERIEPIEYFNKLLS